MSMYYMKSCGHIFKVSVLQVYKSTQILVC